MPAEGALCRGGPVDRALSLIETLRHRPGEGPVRLALHRARMAASADALGLPFDAAGFEAALMASVDPAADLRLRAELFADGRLAVTAAPFTPLSDGTVWRLRLAATRLSSSDPLLRHKTSLRDAYAAARAEFAPAEADEVLLLNEKGHVCEGTITSLFVVDPAGGPMMTPPLEDGLLAGVLRESLIAAGRARPATLCPADLAGRTLFVGNSLRGLIPAVLLSHDRHENRA